MGYYSDIDERDRYEINEETRDIRIEIEKAKAQTKLVVAKAREQREKNRVQRETADQLRSTLRTLEKSLAMLGDDKVDKETTKNAAAHDALSQLGITLYYKDDPNEPVKIE